MTDFAHTHIAQRINRRAEIQEMSRLIMPLLYMIVAIVAASLLWIATADYRDVAAHRMETRRIRMENEIISAKLAQAANEGTVPFNGGMLTCEFKRTRLVPL